MNKQTPKNLSRSEDKHIHDAKIISNKCERIPVIAHSAHQKYRVMDSNKYLSTRRRISRQDATKTDVKQQNETLAKQIEGPGVDTEIAENVADTDLPASKNKITAACMDAEKAERAATMEQIALLE